VFTNLFYFPFLIVTALIYWLLPKRFMRTIFLLLCSLAFILYFDRNAIFVVLGLTVFTYLIASLMEKSSNPTFLHRTGIIGLFLILVIFKYIGFLTATINSLISFIATIPVIKIEKLVLPLGLSYIVFKFISYLTDIYWGVVKKGKFIDFACFASLYTIFVAGPIERFERLKPQFESSVDKFQISHLEIAFERIVFGLFKKLAIADWLGYFINPVWQHPELYSIGIRIAAIFGYSLQIYFDFAGYSDIAIGSSRLFGLQIMENFNNPYLAANISQFWSRWHISLSSCLRDYLFFPLSQNKTNRFWLKVCVPIIAMGLCGLWHGPAWHFVIWGIWHGVGISIYQYWNQIKRSNKALIQLTKANWFKYSSILITFIYVTAGWLWFR
jgi:alginate O-acetyltransferase complex protein AlgI